MKENSAPVCAMTQVRSRSWLHRIEGRTSDFSHVPISDLFPQQRTLLALDAHAESHSLAQTEAYR